MSLGGPWDPFLGTIPGFLGHFPAFSEVDLQGFGVDFPLLGLTSLFTLVLHHFRVDFQLFGVISLFFGGYFQLFEGDFLVFKAVLEAVPSSLRLISPFYCSPAFWDNFPVFRVAF